MPKAGSWAGGTILEWGAGCNLTAVCAPCGYRQCSARNLTAGKELLREFSQQNTDLMCEVWCRILLLSDGESESEVAQSCLTLCDPMDCSLPGSSIHGIFQARVLEWVAISFSRGSSQPRDRTWVSHIVGRCFAIWATTREVMGGTLILILCLWQNKRRGLVTKLCLK